MGSSVTRRRRNKPSSTSFPENARNKAVTVVIMHQKPAAVNTTTLQYQYQFISLFAITPPAAFFSFLFTIQASLSSGCLFVRSPVQLPTHNKYSYRYIFHPSAVTFSNVAFHFPSSSSRRRHKRTPTNTMPLSSANARLLVKWLFLFRLRSSSLLNVAMLFGGDTCLYTHSASTH